MFLVYTTLSLVSQVQARARSPMTKIRCMGSGHSWTNLFADDGSWMMDTSGMNEIVWSPDSPYEVRMSMRMCRGKSYSLMPHPKSSFAPSDKMGRAWYTPGSDCITKCITAT